jgi:hypothetical protein
MKTCDAEANKSSSTSQSGFSLVELLLVLGVMAVLLVAAFVVFPRVSGGREAEYESTQFNGLLAGLIAYRDAAPPEHSLPSPVELLEAGLLSSGRMKDGSWVSAEGAPVALKEVEGNWALSYSDMSMGFCRRFLPQVALYPELVKDVVVNGKSIGVDSMPALEGACGDPKVVDFVLGAGYPDVEAIPAPPVHTDAKDKRWDTQETI